MKYVSQSAQETQHIAAGLARELIGLMKGASHATVLALEGELGAGKTTFVQGFVRALGITRAVVSPTFLLMKRYQFRSGVLAGSVVHLDCYRLKDHRDLAPLELHEVFADPTNIVLIEWPDRAEKIAPRDHITVNFVHAGGDTRTITVRKP